MARLARLAVALLIVQGCAATSRRDEPVAGPFEPATSQVAEGRVVFMRECSHCHPQGEGGLGPSLNNKPLPGFAIKLQVRLGAGTMPAFPPERISEVELDALVAYLEALRAMPPGEKALR